MGGNVEHVVLVAPGQRVQHGWQCPYIRAVRENLNPSHIFTVHHNLDILSGFDLTVSPVVFLHPHEGGIRIGFGIVATPQSISL